MWNGTYKKILERMPDGVFVFDRKLRVVFTNAAFRRSFPDTAKSVGELSKVLACKETSGCGNGSACANCVFYKAMRAAVDGNAETSETFDTVIERSGRMDKLSVRIRVFPVEGTKLFLGLTDGKFEPENKRDLLLAGQVQRRLLPAGKSVAGVPYSLLYVPCFEVGGDMADAYEQNGQAYGIVTDVSGKGYSGGLLASFVKAAFNKKQADLGKALTELHAKFNELNQDECSYITAVTARIDTENKRVRYSVAGHNAPILLKTKDGIHEIVQPSMPISNWALGVTYEEREVEYESGDTLVLLSDGVTECTAPNREQFGVDRVEAVLYQSHGAEDFIHKLRSALTVYSGGKFSDDITVIAFDLP
jgi:hypothetical protein